MSRQSRRFAVIAVCCVVFAVQGFTLTVRSADAAPGVVTFTDPSCSRFAISGTPPNQVVTCVNAAGSVPVCAPSANPAAPSVGTTTTISANCSNQPSANGYIWTGGTCAGLTGPTCSVRSRTAQTLSYTVAASDAAGPGAPATINVTWH